LIIIITVTKGKGEAKGLRECTPKEGVRKNRYVDVFVADVVVAIQTINHSDLDGRRRCAPP
jgi:hypothetical protein